jgi:glycine betaine catabolism B
MTEKTIITKLIGKKEEAVGVKTFTLEPLDNFDYIAGQFAIFSFEKEGKKYLKPFSFSGPPTRRNLEFTTIISGSEFKTALDSLPEGYQITVRGPYGRLILNSERNDKIVFLVGGIGVTPLKSILEYCVDKNISLDSVIFYSNKSPDRIIFRERLEQITKIIPAVKIVITLTDPADKGGQDWRGERGFINDEMVQRYCTSFYERQFYVCGPPAFDNAMKNMLKQDLNLPQESIHTEEFSGY